VANDSIVAPTLRDEARDTLDEHRDETLPVEVVLHAHAPRPFCPKCGSREVETYAASGEGFLYSYVINHRPRPDMGTEPHSIAVVELDEGPRMMTNIVGCPQTPEALQLDMKVKVTFQAQNDDITLPFFEPAEA